MKIRHTIKRLRREQRLAKRIARDISLRLPISRKDRIEYVSRSLAFIKLNIARTRRSFREKAYFSRSNRRNRLVTLANTARTASVEKQIRVYGYSCTLESPLPTPITLKSKSIQVELGPVQIIENFSGLVEPRPISESR